MLVRTLANVVLLRVPRVGVWFTTMERGTYRVSEDPAEIYERLAPLATSKLVIDNEWIPDLEPELWDGDESTADIGAAGRRMGDLDLLPAPFEQRVGADRGAVHDRALRCAANGAQAVEEALRLVAAPRRHLGGGERARGRIEAEQVGERAPDVDPDDHAHAPASALPSAAPVKP